MIAGRHFGHPPLFLKFKTCRTSLDVFKPFALICVTIWSRVKSVQPHIPAGFAATKSSPKVCCNIWAICGLHLPHEFPAFVLAVTSSTVVKPFSVIAFTIVPLSTPLQPQIVSSSAISAIDSDASSPPLVSNDTSV